MVFTLCKFLYTEFILSKVGEFMKDNKFQIGQKIKEIRKKSRLTQEFFSEKMCYNGIVKKCGSTGRGRHGRSNGLLPADPLRRGLPRPVPRRAKPCHPLAPCATINPEIPRRAGEEIFPEKTETFLKSFLF